MSWELQTNCTVAMLYARLVVSKVAVNNNQPTVAALHVLCTYQSFAPPPPMRGNEGPDQGIRLKFYPQGRGILFTSIKLLL